jgi:transposase
MTTETFEFSEDLDDIQHYCGLDVHKYELAVAIYARDDTGHEFTKHGTFGTDKRGLQMAWGFARKYKPVSFAMEATNIYHHVIYTFLEERKREASWDFDVLIFNPADAAGLPGRQKNDKVDAKWIARYLAAGLLNSGRPIVTTMEDLRAIFRAANRIEVDRTAMKNRIKKTLDRAGFRPRGFNLNSQWSRDLVFHLADNDGPVSTLLSGFDDPAHPLHNHAAKLSKNTHKFELYLDIMLSHGQKALIRQDIAELEFKTARKALLAVEIDCIIAIRPGLRALVHAIASIPGFSPFSAAWLLAEVGGVHKYENVSKFLAYCGCCPCKKSSAGKVYASHVSRHSNKHVRTMLYNSAKVVCTILRKDSALKRYASQTMARKGIHAPRLAYSIVASKLARIAFAIMRTGREFAPEPAVAPGNIARPGGGAFTVAERRVVRNARRLLNRLPNLKGLGILGPRARQLAEALDRALQEN